MTTALRHLTCLALLAACPLALAAGSRYQPLFEAHDFFALKAALAADRDPQDEDARFHAAAVLTAFNQPAAANQAIDQLLKDNVDTPLTPKLLQLRLDNDRALGDYPAALDTARTLVDIYERHDDAVDLADAQNTVKLMAALSDAPAPAVTRQDASRIVLQQDGKLGWCIPVVLGDGRGCYILDSGANYSVLIRSEAERLGLKIRKADIDVGSATGARVKADLAVAPLLKLGNLEYHDVVFLVMPNSAFTFKEFRIPGILGFQVFAGMGAVTMLNNHVLQVPEEVPAKRVDNIALDGRDLLVQIALDGRSLLCRLDTGADHTEFYKPYYTKAQADFAKQGGPRQLHSAAAGGMRTFMGYKLKDVTFSVAGRTLTLHKVDVHSADLDPKGDYLDCNLGQDALGQFRAYTINLQAMSLTLH